MERADNATNLKEEEEEGEHQASVGKREVSKLLLAREGKGSGNKLQPGLLSSSWVLVGCLAADLATSSSWRGQLLDGHPLCFKGGCKTTFLWIWFSEFGFAGLGIGFGSQDLLLSSRGRC